VGVVGVAVVAAVLVWAPWGGGPRGVEPASTGPAVARVRLVCSLEGAILGGITTGGVEEARLACPHAAVLGFLVSVDAGAPLHNLFIVGQTEDGDLRWYHPRPDENLSLGLPQAPLHEHPLAGVRLRVVHRPGTVKVWVVFTRTPLDVEFMRRHLSGGGLVQAVPRGSVVQSAELVVE
jgi:hypothetical protein